MNYLTLSCQGVQLSVCVTLLQLSLIHISCWLKDVYVPLEEMPVYVRANAVIPIYPEDVDCTDEMDLSKSMALRIDNDYKGFWTMIDLSLIHI